MMPPISHFSYLLLVSCLNFLQSFEHVQSRNEIGSFIFWKLAKYYIFVVVESAIWCYCQ